jgi:hypothetical protein
MAVHRVFCSINMDGSAMAAMMMAGEMVPVSGSAMVVKAMPAHWALLCWRTALHETRLPRAQARPKYLELQQITCYSFV